MASLLRAVAFIVFASYALGAPASSESVSLSGQVTTSTAAAATTAATVTALSSGATASSTEDSSIPVTTAGFASNDPNGPIFEQTTDPEQMTGSDTDTGDVSRGQLGAEMLGPQNVALQFESPDFLTPPSTDAGSVDNAKWPFALSHNRIQTGGWARQENTGVMPFATAMAGVDMRLKAGAVRELHWHSTAEWAYVLKGTTRVTAVTPDSQNYVADVHAGDIWYFPPGIPHSLQGLNDSGVDGTEFLLVFDSGDFSEDNTFLLTDWMAHIPKEIIEKNFQAPVGAFDHIPENELYIFPTEVPGPISSSSVSAPNGTVTNPFSFALSQMNATRLQGGSVKIIDSSVFKVSTTIAAAEVTVAPGAMRELHWHPTEPEWSFFISGNARVTLFAASGNARTFDYSAGDIGYVPPSFGHYVENVGNDTLTYLEIFKSDRYQDISLQQWLALTPPELVKAHLNLDDAAIASLSKNKLTVVGGTSN